MTTRNFKNNGIFNDSLGAENYSVPEDFDIPSCGIEDVDRAVFNLFNQQLPFSYQHKGSTKRVPVIFATGERFAVLRRKRPLRDRSGATILPLISIMRSGITQAPTMGSSTNQTVPITIRKKLSAADSDYQKILNKAGFKNSRDHAIQFSQEVHTSPTSPVNLKSPRSPGDLDPRQIKSTKARLTTNANATLDPALANNIYRIITIPPPKYYTATYNVTFWTQYTSQMNDILMSLMSLYQSYSQRTFKIETDKGYWFVAYGGESLNPDNNFDEFTDDERLVRYSFDITVPAYIVAAKIPGGQSPIKQTFSAPIISFTTEVVGSLEELQSLSTPKAGIQSGDVEDYVLEDIRTIDAPLPGQAIVGSATAAVDTRGPNKDKNSEIESVGGKDSKNS